MLDGVGVDVEWKFGCLMLWSAASVLLCGISCWRLLVNVLELVFEPA